MAFIEFKVKSSCPLLVNNPQVVNPFNHYSKQIKEITSKRKKTEEDSNDLAKLKFFASLYVNDKGDYFIPAEHFEQAIVSAAKEKKLGAKLQRSFRVESDAILDFKDKKKSPEELFELGTYVDVRDAGIQKSRIMAVRGIFPEWKSKIWITFDSEQIDESDLIACIQVAGERYGVGTYRRKYGRFTVEKV